MTKNKTLSVIVGLIGLVLLSVLTFRLTTYPTFILSSGYTTWICIVILLVGSCIITAVIKAVFKKASSFFVLCLVVSISSVICLLKLYSPVLTVSVPKGYRGEVTLVLSNLQKDNLNIDSNGVGYITKSTFENVYSKPIVKESDGTDISSQAIGFNPSTFWAKGNISNAAQESSVINVKFVSFKIVPKKDAVYKQQQRPDLLTVIDMSKLYKDKR